MNEERRKQQILHILAAGIRKVMEEAHLDYGKLQEIRLRTDQPLLILYQGEDLAKKTQIEMRDIRGRQISMIFQDPMTAVIIPFMRMKMKSGRDF